jgi:carbamoyl-phosphate synthase large subunit
VMKRRILSALSNRARVANRTERHDLGPVLAISSGISQGELGRFPEVARTCEQIAMDLGARGPMNIQCRFMDGAVLVFEINPRFSGTASARALAGFNEPDILFRKHVLGEALQSPIEYRSMTVLRGLTETVFASVAVPRASVAFHNSEAAS